MASQQTPASQPVTQPSPTKTQGNSTPPANAPLTVAGASKPRKTLADLINERFVKLEDLRDTSSYYLWRGVCTKCGWHTHQFDKQAAADLTFKHAQQHWRDLAPLLAAQDQEAGQ